MLGLRVLASTLIKCFLTGDKRRAFTSTITIIFDGRRASTIKFFDELFVRGAGQRARSDDGRLLVVNLSLQLFFAMNDVVSDYRFRLAHYL